MVAEFYTSGPDGHELHISQEFIFPDATTEIQEPPEVSRIDSFPEATYDEAVQTAELAKDTIEAAFEQHKDFINVGPDPTEKVLGLECATSEGLVYFSVRSSDEQRHGQKREIAIIKEDLSALSHEYYISGSGALQRHDYDQGLQDTGLPHNDGEKSMYTLVKLEDEAHTEDLKNREFAASMGFTDKPVGTSEIAYVSKLLESAEPQIITYPFLAQIHQNRTQSSDPTSLPEAIEAGMAFTHDIERYIEREGGNPNEDTGIKKEIVDSDALLRIEVWNNLSEDKVPTPRVHIWHEHDQGGGHYIEEIDYAVSDGVFRSWTRVSTMRDGHRPHSVTSKEQPADFTECISLKYFLRKPMVRRPEPTINSETDQ